MFPSGLHPNSSLQVGMSEKKHMDGLFCCLALCIDEKTSEAWKEIVGPAEALCEKRRFQSRLGDRHALEVVGALSWGQQQDDKH